MKQLDFNNIKPLNGEANEQIGDDLIFRIGDPYIVDGEDINMVSLEDFKDVNLLPESLQLPDVEDYLDYEDGIELDDAEDFLEPDDMIFLPFTTKRYIRSLKLAQHSELYK